MMNAADKPVFDRPAAAQAARRLLRGADRAALATAMRDDGQSLRDDGQWPYPSFVLLATDYDGAPLLFLSGLAEHSRNIAADPRAGLLAQAADGESGPSPEPLAGARLSLLGRLAPTDAPHVRARFLNRHPGAQRLTMLGDFSFYRFETTRAHLVAGFGRARWLTGADLSPPASVVATPDQWLAMESACLTRLNAGRGVDDWRWTGIDPDGGDLRRGGAVRRIDSPLPDDGVVDWSILLAAEKSEYGL